MESSNRKDSTKRFLDIAREEFWIVAKSFFIPFYGMAIGFRELVRTTRSIDRVDTSDEASSSDINYFSHEPAE